MEDRHVIRRRIVVRTVEKAGYIFAYEYHSEDSSSSRQKNQLRRIEDEMTKRFNNDSCLRDIHSACVFKFTDKLVAVAVDFTSKQTWVRGFVLEEKRIKSGIRLKIQLIDYCSQNLFSPEAVRPLPSEFNTSVLECQSMKLVLYGIEPAYFKIGFDEGNKLAGSMNFYDKDITVINKQFDEAQSIYFEEICRVEEFYFGNIILKQNNGSLLNLKDLLLQSYCAIKIPDFENNIPKYIEGFRRYTSVFDHELAVRKLLFPSILFSDVERSTDPRNHVEYYPNPPVDNEVSTFTETKVSSRSNSDDVHESTCSNTSKKTLPAASLVDVEESSDEWSKLIDKIVVITGGPNNSFQPVDSFSASPLDSETFQMLIRLQIRDMTRCQKYLVPAVLSGQNVTIVEEPGSGKTLGVLISLVSLMWRSAKEKVRGLGARTIVVCPYAAKCELIQKNCIQIIQGRRRITDVSGDPVSVNVAYGLGTELENKNMIDLLKGYDILACTPRRLLRLLQHDKTFHFARLSHIVFDDMNTLLNSYSDEIKQILDHVRRKPKKRPQRIIISDQWIPELKPFVKEDIEHQCGSLLISSYIDAALFAHLKAVWTGINDEDKKVGNIAEMLTGTLKHRNVLVVFSDDDDINAVHDEIRYKCQKFIYKIGDFELLNASDTVRDWQNEVVSGNFPILFCTDYALRNLQIYEADYLIHYSLPKSKSDFLFRFSVLLHRLQTIADRNMKPGKPQIPRHRWPEMYIYSNNKENDEQFPEIVKIMRQLNAEIPDTDRMRNILLRKEMAKKEFGLCPYLKEFGRCHLESRCKFRHIVLQDDMPDKTLPSNGYIKILIVHVYSATHYGVRILEHAAQSSGPWSPVKELPSPHIIPLKLTQHFSDRQNRKIRVHNEVGDVVAFEKNDIFHRVQIIKFLQHVTSEKEEERKTPKRALVKFIDEGWEEEISTLCLMELPPLLASIPPGIVDVFICNLLPVDEDIAWGDKITSIVRHQLKDSQNSENFYLMGKIELVLGRTLWLDSLKCEEVKPELKEPVTIYSIPKMLKKERLAVGHEGHLPSLLRLCKDAGLEEAYFPIRNNNSDENVLDRNTDSNTVPSNTNIPSNNDHIFKKPNSVELKGRINELNVLDRNTDTNTVPSNNNIPSNNDHVFKKPNSVERINELSSVSKTPLKPQVEWRQDSAHVILDIAVNSDPNNFKVQITNEAKRKQSLYFCAWTNEKLYEFSEILFCRVRGAVESYKSGVSIRIKMIKAVRGSRWSRLFQTKTPYRWVRIDQNDLDSSNDRRKNTAHQPAPILRRNICADLNNLDSETSASDSADDSDTPGFYCEG